MLTVELETLNLKAGQRVLDLGCGEGRHIHNIYDKADVEAIGVDLSFEDVMKTREGFGFFSQIEKNRKGFYGLTVSDGRKLPFADASFDRIVCSEVLEHIIEYQDTLAEISRILKPGGLLAVSVPRAWPEKICWSLSEDYHNTPGGHVRIFKESDLKQAIQGAGFKLFRRHWAHALHVPYWWLKCLFWDAQDDFWLIRAYHRFLVWDLMKKPVLTRFLERLTNPIMGKSVVLYFTKDAPC